MDSSSKQQRSKGQPSTSQRPAGNGVAKPVQLEHWLKQEPSEDPWSSCALRYQEQSNTTTSVTNAAQDESFPTTSNGESRVTPGNGAATIERQ